MTLRNLMRGHWHHPARRRKCRAQTRPIARGERLAQGVAVDLVGLGDINQKRSRFDDRKLASADEVASLIGAGQM